MFFQSAIRLQCPQIQRLDCHPDVGVGVLGGQGGYLLDNGYGHRLQACLGPVFQDGCDLLGIVASKMDDLRLQGALCAFIQTGQ